MKLMEIGTILEIHRGKMPLNFSNEHKEGYFPYLDVEWMRTGRIRRYCDSLKGVVCDVGDILIVDRGSAGLVGKAIKGVVGSTLVRLSSGHLIRDYLYYFLLDKEHLLKSKGKSVMIPQIDWNFLKSLQIPLPSLNEQQKTVAPLVLLDAEGGGIKRLQELCWLYKKAVLKEAFEGKLTADWRKEHPEHSPLKDFESIRLKRQKFKDTNLDEHEIELELPESWLRPRIGETFSVVRGRTPTVKCKEFWEGGYVNFVNSREIKWNYLSDTESKLTQRGVDDFSMKIQPPGTLLVSTVTIVRASILSAFCAHSTDSTDSTAIETTKTPCVPEFFFYYLQFIFEGIKKLEYGSAVHAIDKEKIRALRIPFTSFEEQREVVREIESRFALVSSIEKLGSDFELLKKVALKETFSLLVGS